MEKFSNFRDPLTGINPFLAPTYKKLTIKTVILAAFRLPIYILYLLGFPTIGFLIKIKLESKTKPKGVVFCNSVTEFDRKVIEKVFGITNFDYSKYKTCVCFPENTCTNNRGILKYENKQDCEYAIGLRYSNECIYMYGNRLAWLINFLGNENFVKINVIKGSNLEIATCLPMLKLTSDDKTQFMSSLSA